MLRLSQYMGDFHPEAQVNGLAMFNLIALICNNLEMISAELWPMKYTIFFENRKLVINETYIDEFLNDQGFFIRITPTSNLAKILNFFESTPSIKTLHLFGMNPVTVFNGIQEHFVPVKAAGGIVRNSSGEFLMIERNGVWDLPKGKLDGNETPEETALREVSEECGIQELTIKSVLGSTFHTYLRNERKYLKETHWFEMAYHGNGIPTPQTIEGITRTEWVPERKLYPKLKNTYGSVVQVFRWVGVC